jgi:GTPase SAR1 family protein
MQTAKVMLLGEMGTGKTSLSQRLIFDRFVGNYKTTIGVQILTCDVKVGRPDADDKIRLVLWDTDGDFGSQILDTIYVSGASAAVIVSDASRPQTITRMFHLVDDFERKFPGRPFRAIVNKIDLIEAGPGAIKLSDHRAADVLFTSAKTGEGVEAAFRELGETILRRTGP